MSGWTAALIVVVAVVAAVVLPHEVRLYRRSRQRRGGALELDTPEARAAIADPDDWFAEHPDERLSQLRGHRYELPADIPRNEHLEAVMAPVRASALRRCNPDRKIHYHGAGDRCQCGELPNTWSRDDAA